MSELVDVCNKCLGKLIVLKGTMLQPRYSHLFSPISATIIILAEIESLLQNLLRYNQDPLYKPLIETLIFPFVVDQITKKMAKFDEEINAIPSPYDLREVLDNIRQFKAVLENRLLVLQARDVQYQPVMHPGGEVDVGAAPESTLFHQLGLNNIEPLLCSVEIVQDIKDIIRKDYSGKSTKLFNYRLRLQTDKCREDDRPLFAALIILAYVALKFVIPETANMIFLRQVVHVKNQAIEVFDQYKATLQSLTVEQKQILLNLIDAHSEFKEYYYRNYQAIANVLCGTLSRCNINESATCG